MIRWQYYPKSDRVPQHLEDVITIFENQHSNINSDSHYLVSNEVLSLLANELIEIGYNCELSKKREHEIKVPVLYGENGKLEKYFLADAYNMDNQTVIEVEAGRAYVNNQFLKDLFQACLMDNVFYLVIAVRQVYKESKDFEKVTAFFDSLYASQRLKLPLKGILIVGY